MFHYHDEGETLFGCIICFYKQIGFIDGVDTFFVRANDTRLGAAPDEKVVELAQNLMRKKNNAINEVKVAESKSYVDAETYRTQSAIGRLGRKDT